MAETPNTKTIVSWRTSNGTASVETFDNAIGKIVDGCLIIATPTTSAIYAPGYWTRSLTEKVDG